jgi:hypothetical protein
MMGAGGRRDWDDETEIRLLVEAYALAMDTADLQAFEHLFVPDGSLIVWSLGRDRPLGAFRGPGPQGVGLVARLLDDLYAATLHHITTHRSVVDGDTASATTYCLAYHVVAEPPALETLGVRYEDVFDRTAAGWRIRDRNATRLWSQVTSTPPTPLLVDHAAGRARTAGAG